MKKHFFIAVFLTCLILTGMAGRAQVKGDLIEESLGLKFPFTIYQYSTKQGLPQNQVVDISCKKNGNLVLSTANGIVEYNGSGFRSFIEHEDYKKGIMVRLFWHEGTQQLFGMQNTGRLWQLYPNYKKIGDYLCQLEGNKMVLLDFDGIISRFDVTDPGFRMTRVGQANVGGAINFVFHHQRKYYIGTVKSLYVYDERTGTTRELMNGLFLRMVKDPYTGNLYAIEGHAIYRMGGQAPEKIFDLQNRLSKCEQMAFIETGEIYIATTEGLYEKSDDGTRLYNKKNILPSQHIQSLYYDENDHCLYAGTTERGLLRLQLKTCYTYSYREGFPENCAISSMLKTKAGEVLGGGPEGYLFQVKHDTVLPYMPDRFSHGCMAEIDGKIYAGTWGEGIRVIEQKKTIDSIFISKKNFSPINYTHSIFKDSGGWYWIGTSQGICRGRNMTALEPYLAKDITGEIICIYERANGHVCIGGSNGVYILDRQHRLIKHLGKKQGLTCKEVRNMYEDKEGKLWIGAYNGGIYCYEGQKLTSINRQKNAMLDADAFCFAPDQYGYLYISSNHGLWRISEKDLNDFYRGKLPYLVPFYYSEEDGILNTEFNGGFQNNYIRARQDHLYFPNLQGLVAVVPEKPVFRKIMPVVDHILVNDTLTHSLETPLARNTASVRFDFSGNSFLAKYNVYYQYKITRNNDPSAWNAMQKNGSVTFHSLQPGKYTLTIRAIDAFNDRNPTEISYGFEILPYFYETTWFMVAMVLLFLVLTIVTGRIRIHIYKRKAEEKERYKRQLAELELKAIHDRMNPHFVFNSLNSIKYYLSVNDREKANRYLDGFSVLLRKFTESGNQNFITVRREMEMISTYVELEQMRMNNAFESRINIDPAVLDVYIPTITLQPFVENAIKHGIAHATHPCVLSISIQAEKKGMIKCVIEDNGIGRKRSQAINASRVDHISSGLNMVEEKKHIVQTLFNIGLSIEIEDKYGANRAAMGTKVTILIPEKHD